MVPHCSSPLDQVLCYFLNLFIKQVFIIVYLLIIYRYDSPTDMLKDFKTWLVQGFGKTAKVASQTISSLQEIWKSIDPTMDIVNNKLKACDVEDYYFVPLFTTIKEQMDLPQEKRINHIQASTLSSKLTSLKHLTLFLASRDIYIGY